MSLKGHLRDTLGVLLRRQGYEIVDARLLYPWQMSTVPDSGMTASPIPDGARSQLDSGHPSLIDLQKRYAACDPAVTTPFVWVDSHVSAQDMLRFRGENAYVWQIRGPSMSPLAYALTTYYVKSIDELRLMDRLSEDDRFGVLTMQVDGRTISRDLLDSIVEICFLEKHLKLSSRPNFRILDIGAGYGRMAHRVTSAFTNVEQYLCTDAYPTSTFICDYYLKYRGIGDRAKSIPLDHIEGVLQEQAIDLALNIHSFSECRPEAIEWWVSRLAMSKVKHLMIVPNSGESQDGSVLKTNDGIDFTPIVQRHGYRRVAVEPKYRDSVVQRFAINATYHHLYELI